MPVLTLGGSTHNWERSEEAYRQKLVWANWAVCQLCVWLSLGLMTCKILPNLQWRNKYLHTKSIYSDSDVGVYGFHIFKYPNPQRWAEACSWWQIRPDLQAAGEKSCINICNHFYGLVKMFLFQKLTKILLKSEYWQPNPQQQMGLIFVKMGCLKCSIWCTCNIMNINGKTEWWSLFLP